MKSRSSAGPVKVIRAKVNNLKSVSLEFEPSRLYVLVGPSGSGKSSLAFDVIYAEADRLGRASGLYRVFRKDHPDYLVEGLPARIVGIEQQILNQTMVESIGSYTGFVRRVLGSGVAVCPRCKGAGYIRDVDLGRLVKDADKPVIRGAFPPSLKALAGLDSARWARYCARVGVEPSTKWKVLPGFAQRAIFEGGDPEFKGVATALRQVAEHGTGGLTRDAARQIGEELNFYITNTVCPACEAYGYLAVDRKLIRPEETLGTMLDRGLIQLPEQERKWLEELGLRGLPVLRPLFNLSTTEARSLRFLANIIGLDEPTLIIFDEPAAGLLPWEAGRLARLFMDMRSSGHTILAIEHSREIVDAADIVVAFGPGAGSQGGKVVFTGPPKEYFKSPSSPYGAKAPSLMVRRAPSAAPPSRGATRGRRGRASSRRVPASQGEHHLNAKFKHWFGFSDFAVDVPLGRLVCVCGPSGSGKTAYLQAAFASCDKTPTGWQGRVLLADRQGCDRVRRPYLITPEAIGKHAGSTPATYIGLWDRIRDLYAELPEAKRRHLDKSAFSFNTPKGQCPHCLGHGFITENHIRFNECPVCHGMRFNLRANSVAYRGRSIAAINGLTVNDCLPLFRERPAIAHYLEFLETAALEYLVLGQPSNSLSGGEAQRVKIAAKLCRRLGDRSLYILDNPCRGIGITAVPRLYGSLRGLVDKNNTVLIAENTKEIASSCDWLVILGQPLPEKNGRRLHVLYEGPGGKCPRELWENTDSAKGGQL